MQGINLCSKITSPLCQVRIISICGKCAQLVCFVYAFRLEGGMCSTVRLGAVYHAVALSMQ